MFQCTRAMLHGNAPGIASTAWGPHSVRSQILIRLCHLIEVWHTHLRVSSLLIATSSAEEWLITLTATGRSFQEPAPHKGWAPLLEGAVGIPTHDVMHQVLYLVWRDEMTDPEPMWIFFMSAALILVWSPGCC
jgi:hypothetical protein